MLGFRANFADGKEKIRRRTVCTSRIFDAVSGKICRKTSVEWLCGQVLNIKNKFNGITKAVPNHHILFRRPKNNVNISR